MSIKPFQGSFFLNEKKKCERQKPLVWRNVLEKKYVAEDRV